MAMRGDDIIAIRMPDEGPPLEFLKAETKSRATLAAATNSKRDRAKQGRRSAVASCAFVCR